VEADSTASSPGNFKMKREDLAKVYKSQTKTLSLVLLVFLGGVLLSVTGVFERVNPSWSPSRVLPVLGALTIVAVLLLVQKGLAGFPKCPHCKRLLTGWLLHIAIASGNCGYCGKSVED